MTTIARQIPHMRRVLEARATENTSTDCQEESATDSFHEPTVALRHGHRSAQAEHTWVEAAASVGMHMPRG